MKQRRLGGAITVVLAATALIGCVQGGPIDSSGLKSGATSPSPSTALTVSKAIQLRDAGELDSNQITLSGFWTDRMVGHSCVPIEQPIE